MGSKMLPFHIFSSQQMSSEHTPCACTREGVGRVLITGKERSRPLRAYRLFEALRPSHGNRASQDHFCVELERGKGNSLIRYTLSIGMES